MELGCISLFLQLIHWHIEAVKQSPQSVVQQPIIEVTSYEREMILKGVTIYSCQSKYLPLRTRKTRVEGWLSRILSGLPIGLLVLQLCENKNTACWRSPLEQIDGGRGHSRNTYQTQCFLSSCLDSASHPVSKTISVIAVHSLISGGDTI